MSNDELRRMFDTVLTAPPPDTSDIDATVRAGRRRRHRRTAAILLSSASAIAAIGITATAVLPGLHRQPAAPAASAAATSAPFTVGEGIMVTSARQLLGAWQTIQLDGLDVHAARDLGDGPLIVNFSQYGGHLWWGANDIVNYESGLFSVSKQGQFHAHPGFMTAVGPPTSGPQYQRNPEAVKQATEARIVAATPTDSSKLLLLTAGKLIAVYTPADAGSPSASPRPAGPGAAPSATGETDGTPDLSRGIDKTRIQDSAYQEKLSSVTEKLSAASSEISTKLAASPDLVGIGFMPGVQTIVLYWSGAANSPALSQALEIAKRRGVSALVAPRRVSKSQLSQAESDVKKNMRLYNGRGIYLSTFGGFAADFDGFKVMVDNAKSTTKDVAAIQSLFESNTGVPVQVSLGTVVNY